MQMERDAEKQTKQSLVQQPLVHQYTSVVNALNRILAADNKALFSKKDPQFHDFMCTLDSVSSELHH